LESNPIPKVTGLLICVLVLASACSFFRDNAPAQELLIIWIAIIYVIVIAVLLSRLLKRTK